MKKKIELFDIINNTILVLIAIACIYPFIYTLAVSLSDGKYVLAGNIYFLPKGLTLEAYEYILNNPRLGIMRGVYNSLYYTVFGTIIAVFVTYMTAYVLSRKRVKGRYFIMLLFIISWIFEAGLVPTYAVFNALGLVNTRWVMILPTAINTFYLIVTRSFLDALPVELEESAYLDGANDIQIMWYIFLPLSMPIIATIGVFYAIANWNSFMVPLIYLHDEELHPIQLIIYNLVIAPSVGGPTFSADAGSTILPKNLEAATVFLGMLPILFVYPFAQRYFVKGLMVGSIKG